MALPPEPLAELLPLATLIVDAEVTKVLSAEADPKPTHPVSTKPASDKGTRYGAQKLELKVKKALRGTASSTPVIVTKPEGVYSLRAGAQGVFLLDASGAVLGRYGPDTWRRDVIERALA